MIPRPPVIALAIGDPAGVGPELAAQILSDPEIRAAAQLVVVGDRRILERGAIEAQVSIDVDVRGPADPPVPAKRPMLLDLANLDPARIRRGTPSREGGRFALANFDACLRLAAAGRVQAVCFTPFNKTAMRLADPRYDDAIAHTAETLGLNVATSEFNILDGLWNARVTSHIPLAQVPPLITTERVLAAIRLTNAALQEAGIPHPRIAVAGLNPHAGDDGNAGHEDERAIRPAIDQAAADGLDAQGPFPPDTVFLHATRGQFDAVLTMYHDQGQIAMKLIGFDRGVTLLGGFPFPICTPAHGSAYDIAGKGLASPAASKAAVLLAAGMARKTMDRAAA